MRVIAGKARGTGLSSPDGINTRPTLDRVKEAVFSSLNPYLNGACSLDLFSGSGGLGIEALSRGGAFCTFVDNSREAISYVKKNLEKTNLINNSKIVFSDYLSFLKSIKSEFDIIFLDPPYAGDLYLAATEMIADNHLLTDEGIIIMEWDSGLKIPDFSDKFISVKEKKYGRVAVSFLKWG